MAPVTGSLERFLAANRNARVAAQRDRSRREVVPTGTAEVRVDGRTLVNFSSNDYLGLAADPRLAEAVSRGARDHATGSGASALVSGYSPVLRELEQALAAYLGREAALVFPSGYQANLAAITSLAGRGDHVIQDRLCHASLIDGAQLSGARLLRYPHADLQGLERQLRRAAGSRTLVVTDGVFSMDGDLAPLQDIAALCERHDAWLMVDDAHGIGVIGPQGQGSVASAALGPAEVPVLTGTLGKAFGAAGAFVAGSRELVEHLVNQGRSYLFTTALSPALAAAALAALDLVRMESWRRDALQANIDRFRSGARALGLAMTDSDSPIQPLVTGESGRAVALSERLQQAGYLVVAIRPPTVPRGTSRLRVTLGALHSFEQVDGLLEALERAL